MSKGIGALPQRARGAFVWTQTLLAQLLFWQMTNDNPKAVYACLNYNEAFCPKQIEKQSICLDGDAGAILDLMTKRVRGNGEIR